MGDRHLGPHPPGNEAARAKLLATEEARRGVLLSLVSDVAQAYFELLALDAQLEIARTDHRRRFRAPTTCSRIASSSAWPRSSRPRGPRASLAAAQATIPELESQIAAKENQISILLGRNPGADPARHAAVRPARRRRPCRPGCPPRCSSAGPTSARPSSSWSRANAQVGVAKAEFFPKLSLTGFLGRRARRCRRSRRASPIWAIAAGLDRADLPGRPHPRELPRHGRRLGAGQLQYEQTVSPRSGRSRTARRRSTSWARPRRSRSARSWRSRSRCSSRPIATSTASPATTRCSRRSSGCSPRRTRRRDPANRLTAYVQLYKALGGGWNVKDPQTPATASLGERAACAGMRC